MNLRALAAADPDTPSGSAGAEWQLHAVRFDPNVSATNAGAYVAKGGDWTPAEEMTRSDLKTGRTGNRTPFQILADYTRPATPATATSGANSAASPALCA